jgi:hypothetical protein
MLITKGLTIDFVNPKNRRQVFSLFLNGLTGGDLFFIFIKFDDVDVMLEC